MGFFFTLVDALCMGASLNVVARSALSREVISKMVRGVCWPLWRTSSLSEKSGLLSRMQYGIGELFFIFRVLRWSMKFSTTKRTTDFLSGQFYG